MKPPAYSPSLPSPPFLPINQMFSTRLLSLQSTRLLTRTPRALITLATRNLHTTTPLNAKDSKMSTSPPKHELVYFEGLTSKVRAFGQFRKVIHTGLYSQLVTMEIPVGGDIGNEVHLVDQVLIFTSGEGKAVVGGKEQVRIYIPYTPRLEDVRG
jgi:mannose-6-phosphate isomerase-like protein (cupin superfamily)